MFNCDFAKGVNGFLDDILANINMAKTASASGFGPVDSASIVIVDHGRGANVKKIKITQDVAKPEDGFGTHVGGHDFGLAGTATGAGFFVTSPKDGSGTIEDDMATN